LNTVAAQAVLRLEDGTSVTVPYLTPSPGIEIIGRTSSSLSDVKVGDKVTLQLDSNRDKAVAIQVHRVLQQTVVSVDAASRKIRLTNAEGVTSDYTLALDTKLLNTAGQTAVLAQFAAGQTVNVSYVGKTIEAIQAVEIKVGRVVAAVPGVVTVRDYAGSVSDVNLGTAYKVVKNGVTSTSTAVLAEGDRVT